MWCLDREIHAAALDARRSIGDRDVAHVNPLVREAVAFCGLRQRQLQVVPMPDHAAGELRVLTDRCGARNRERRGCIGNRAYDAFHRGDFGGFLAAKIIDRSRSADARSALRAGGQGDKKNGHQEPHVRSFSRAGRTAPPSFVDLVLVDDRLRAAMT